MTEKWHLHIVVTAFKLKGSMLALTRFGSLCIVTCLATNACWLLAMFDQPTHALWPPSLQVKQTMARIKQVLTERAAQEPTSAARKLAMGKINAK